MVLTPSGFDFAPHPMLVETDREKYAIQRIVEFYERQQTDFASYFEAAWRFKHRRRSVNRQPRWGQLPGREGVASICRWCGSFSRRRR